MSCEMLKMRERKLSLKQQLLFMMVHSYRAEIKLQGVLVVQLLTSSVFIQLENCLHCCRKHFYP